MASNARNLANLLGTGQSTISAEKLGSDVPPGTEDYSSIDSLGVGTTIGETAFVEGSNRLYIWNGSGWYNIALINTTPTWDSGGQPAGSYVLDGDSPQDATVITLAASDPEGLPISYNYITSGSMDSIATISQDSSVFTITPKTSVQAPNGGTGSITFRATDGINILPQVSSFTLSFVTLIENSRYTTLLATAINTSDNNNITDASSNNHSITVNGDAYAGTFSPHRSGGYSTYFDGTGDYLQTSSIIPAGAFTVSCWAYFNTSNADAVWSQGTSGNAGRTSIQMLGSSLFFGIGSTNVTSSSGSILPKIWYYIEAQYSGSQMELFINGSSVGTASNTTNPQNSNFHVGTLGSSWDSSYELDGYISDLKIVSGTPSGSSTAPTAPLPSSGSSLHICHLPYIADGSGNTHSITVSGNVSTKPFSPYDYTEYSAADHGGSVYSDGTGDYLESPFNAIGTGDFTVECWAYLTSFNDLYDGLFSGATIGGARGPVVSRDVWWLGSNSGAVGFSNTQNKLELNRWQHVAISREGSSARAFYNGVLLDTQTTTMDLNQTTMGLFERYTGGSNLSQGYIADFRITNGSAIYTSDFTPPTAPLSSSGAELHIKGTDASIIDKSQGSNLKLIGGPTGSTTQAKFANTKSIDFGDGSQTYVMEVSSGAGYTGEFTIEFWMYNTYVTSTWQSLISNSYVSGSEYFRLYKQINNGQFALYHNSTSAKLSSIGNIVNNTWTHVAIVRDSSNDITVYQDGISIGSYNNNQVFGTASSPVNVGKGGVGDSTNYPMSGYIQDFRITNGLARYTTNFTPPTASLEG